MRSIVGQVTRPPEPIHAVHRAPILWTRPVPEPSSPRGQPSIRHVSGPVRPVTRPSRPSPSPRSTLIIDRSTLTADRTHLSVTEPPRPIRAYHESCTVQKPPFYFSEINLNLQNSWEIHPTSEKI